MNIGGLWVGGGEILKQDEKQQLTRCLMRWYQCDE